MKINNKIAILQSNYIPWKGYFDIIGMADIFVFYDDVQFTPRDWRSRNKIKTTHGTMWLTIPCGKDRNRLICEVEIKDPSWQDEHWNTIEHFYKKAKYFKYYKDFFQEIFKGKIWKNLSEFNQYVIKKISYEILNFNTEFIDSRIFQCKEKKLHRILEILDKFENISEYISGPSAKDYLTEDEFKKRNLKLIYMNYSNYPEYTQLYGSFIHEVTILDLIFNEGSNAIGYMKSYKA